MLIRLTNVLEYKQIRSHRHRDIALPGLTKLLCLSVKVVIDSRFSFGPFSIERDTKNNEKISL